MTVTEGDAGTVNATFTVTPVRGQRPDRHRRLRHRRRHGDGARRLHRRRAARSPSPPARRRDGHRPGQRRHCSTRPNETFFVNLSSPVERDHRRRPGPGTITDDDPLPTLSINDVTVTEGNSGTVDATFTVSLSRRQRRAGDRRLRDRQRHGRAPADYTAATGTLTFAPGQTTRHGHRPRQRRHCSTRRTRRSSSTCRAGQRDHRRRPGLGTITDDDAAAGLSINDVTVTEGNSGHGRRHLHGHARRQRPTVTVDYATANGTAHAPGDYAGRDGHAHFRAGRDDQTVTVHVNGDTARRANETFFVNLRAPTNATIARRPGHRHDHRRRRAADPVDQRRRR